MFKINNKDTPIVNFEHVITGWEAGRSIPDQNEQLAHFMPLIFYYTPRKHQKTFDFPFYRKGVQKDFRRKSYPNRHLLALS